jgi:hypothetical protein
VTVEVAEQVVDVLRGSGVPVPLADVEGEEGLISVGFRYLNEAFEVFSE